MANEHIRCSTSLIVKDIKMKMKSKSPPQEVKIKKIDNANVDEGV